MDRYFPAQAHHQKTRRNQNGFDWVAVVKPGRVLFEMAGVPEDIAREAMRLASHKLPVKCKFVKKEEITTEGGEG